MGTGEARERVAYHGGDLAAARKLFPAAPEPWLDLSTGINPRPYPVGPLEADLWHRLPGRDAIQALEVAAACADGAADPGSIVAAPGTQALIQLLPRVVPARRVGILGFTYGEHGRAWAAAGAEVTRVETIAALADCDVAVVVNPNNPDGRLLAPEQLLGLGQSPGLLVVDEAFMDVVRPGASLIPALPRRRTIVLRSFGKAYGLAGLRLGFAAASADLVDSIRDALGPWAVSGPAVAIGSAALRDAAWLGGTLERLEQDAAHLDMLLRRAGFTIAGGTALFRLAQSPDAPAWFERLARAGILTRPFAHRPDWLRFGLCGDEAAWDRLAAALGRTSPANSPALD